MWWSCSSRDLEKRSRKPLLTARVSKPEKVAGISRAPHPHAVESFPMEHRDGTPFGRMAFPGWLKSFAPAVGGLGPDQAGIVTFGFFSHLQPIAVGQVRGDVSVIADR